MHQLNMYKKYIYKYLNIFSSYVTKNLYLNNFSCILTRSRKEKQTFNSKHTHDTTKYVCCNGNAITGDWNTTWNSKRRNHFMWNTFLIWMMKKEAQSHYCIFFFLLFLAIFMFSFPCLVFIYKKVVIDSLHWSFYF